MRRAKITGPEACFWAGRWRRRRRRVAERLGHWHAARLEEAHEAHAQHPRRGDRDHDLRRRRAAAKEEQAKKASEGRVQGEPPAHLCARQRAPLRARRRQGACREHEVELVLLRRDPPLECAPRGWGRQERRDGKLPGSRPRIRRLLVVADAPVSVVPCRPVMCRSLATLLATPCDGPCTASRGPSGCWPASPRVRPRC